MRQKAKVDLFVLRCKKETKMTKIEILWLLIGYCFGVAMLAGVAASAIYYLIQKYDL